MDTEANPPGWLERPVADSIHQFPQLLPEAGQRRVEDPAIRIRVCKGEIKVPYDIDRRRVAVALRKMDFYARRRKNELGTEAKRGRKSKSIRPVRWMRQPRALS